MHESVSLDEIYTTLRASLYSPLLVYIPKTPLITSAKELKEILLQADVFGRLLLLDDTHGLNIYLADQKDYHKIVHKEATLDHNIFILLDYKATLKKQAFAFLMDKYIEDLSIFIYLTRWLSENFTTYIKQGKNSKLDKQVFDIQKSVFEKHTLKLKKYFPKTEIPYLSEIKTTHLIERLFPENINHLDQQLKRYQAKTSSNEKQQKATPSTNIHKLRNLFEDNSIKDEKNEKNIVTSTRETATIKQIKKKNQMLITDREARSFLLSHVFHVDSALENQ